MSLYRLIGQFLRRHSAAYASSGAMLVGIAVLIVLIPRQIGHVIDALVANRLHGMALAQQLAWLLVAGMIVYFGCSLPRIGWASNCGNASTCASHCRGPRSSRPAAPAT
jgi:ATP-binding cassette subfamily B multidrug efflux pump